MRPRPDFEPFEHSSTMGRTVDGPWSRRRDSGLGVAPIGEDDDDPRDPDEHYDSDRCEDLRR